jgi:RNA recognition motif. (a.k.a. RRM, RBD, or RNP domain)
VDVRQLCERYGSVTDVFMPAASTRGMRNQGFAHVTFAARGDCADAVRRLDG